MVSPPELIAGKVIAYHQRRGQPKPGTDWRDVAMLLAFPDLKRNTGPIADRLTVAGAAPEVLALWHDLVSQEISAPDEDEGF